MVAELSREYDDVGVRCSLAKISMVAEQPVDRYIYNASCSLAKISMVAEPSNSFKELILCCSLAKISMVAELQLHHHQ